MWPRVRAAFRASLVLLVVIVLAWARALASAGEGVAEISIVDAASGRAVAVARVALSGTDPGDGQIAYSDTNGRIVIENLAAGTYKLSVYAAGFAIERATISISPGDTTSTVVKLSPVGQPKIIAVVTSVTRPSARVDRAAASSTLTAVDGGLSQALLQLPGVHDVSGGVAVDGFSPNATPATIDGFRIGGAGTGAALSPVGLDLFQSVAVRPAGAAGGPGIDLTTTDPTIAFNAQGVGGGDSRSGTNDAFTMRGTAGYAGYVFRSVQRTQVGPLDGGRYLDASGLSYDHQDFTSGNGWLTKARLPFGRTQSLLVESSAIDAAGSPVCNVASGGIPCGYGPGNTVSSSFRDSAVRYTAIPGRTTLSLGLGSSISQDTQDFRARLVNTISDPLFSSGLVHARSVDFHADGPLTPSNDLSLDVSAFDQRFAPAVPGLPATSVSSRFSSIVVADQIASTSAFQSNASLALTDAAATHLSARLGTSVQLRGRDSFGAQVTLGASNQPALPVFPALGSIADPPSAVYDCLHGRIFAAGNSDQPGDPTDSGVALNYRHSSNTAAFQVSATSDVVSNAFVSTLLPGSSSGSNAISASALQALNAFYTTSGGCGVPIVLTPDHVILNVDRNALLKTDRITTSVARSIGPGLLVAPYVQLTDSRYRLDGTWHQTSYVPYLRAGLLSDYRFDHGLSEVLTYVDFSGRNNANGTPPYALVNVGLSRALRHGTATLSLTNTTAAYGASFASSSFAAPLPSGIVPIAQPFGRPSLRFSYAFNAGSSSPPQRISALDALASFAQPSSDMMTVSYSIVPTHPLPHPFDPETTLDSCTPELVDRARAVLDVLRNADQADRGRSGMVDRPLSIDSSVGVSIDEHLREGSVAFTVTPKNNVTARALLSCTTQHIDSISDAKVRGLYVPQTLPKPGSAFLFDGRVGVYTLDQDLSQPVADDKSTSTINLEAPPAVAPKDPFVVRDSCPSLLRPFATAVTGGLRRDIPALFKGRSIAASQYYRLQKHAGSRGAWISVRFLDALGRSSLEECLHVAGVSQAQLQENGVDGVVNQLDFATRFGFYETYNAP